MRQRLFGKTGWAVSPVGFGCWGLGGGWGARDDRQAREAIRRALELGVNFFDTAYVYGAGHSERLLGEALRSRAGSAASTRPPVRVATKVPAKNMQWPADPRTPISAAYPADWIVRCTETSLRRLRLERLDLQQLHVWTDAWAGADEWRKAADRLKREGKISAFGVSINDHEPESALQLVAGGAVESVQVIYNIFDQSAEERLFPLCRERGVAVIARVPFDEGSLTGSFTLRTRFPRNDWRAGYFRGERLGESCRRVERLRSFLRPGLPGLSALALRFVLSHPAVSTVIPGMRRASHVEENWAAAGQGQGLTSQERRRLKEHAWPRNFYAGAWD